MCLRLPVAAIYTETQERKVDLWLALGKFVKEKDRERYGDRKTNIERKRRVQEHERKMQATEREGIEFAQRERVHKKREWIESEPERDED